MSERLETVIPSQGDAELAARASRVLSSNQTNETLHVRLDDGQEMTLPKAATRLLADLLSEMAQGHAVTMIPVHTELTTQQVADLLNVSRPHVIKLLEDRAIPFHKVGTHRRVTFADLEAYQSQFERKRRIAMDELAAEAQALGMGY